MNAQGGCLMVRFFVQLLMWLWPLWGAFDQPLYYPKVGHNNNAVYGLGDWNVTIWKLKMCYTFMKIEPVFGIILLIWWLIIFKENLVFFTVSYMLIVCDNLTLYTSVNSLISQNERPVEHKKTWTWDVELCHVITVNNYYNLQLFYIYYQVNWSFKWSSTREIVIYKLYMFMQNVKI